MELIKIYCISKDYSSFQRLEALNNIILRMARMEENLNVAKFVAHEPIIANMDFLIFDLTTVEISEEQLMSAVSLLRKFMKAQPIIVANKSAYTDVLFAKLCSNGAKRCIAVEEQKQDVSESIIKAITAEQNFSETLNIIQNGLTEEARRITSPDIFIPKGKKITIAVAGAMGRIGTTTQAFGIYRYLEFLGFQPLLVDEQQTFTENLCRMFPKNTQPYENFIKINNYCFSPDIQQSGFNAFILHLDVLNDTNIGKFKTADIHILVGGAKEWEMEAVAKVVGNYGLLGDENMSLVLSFCLPVQAQAISDASGISAFVAPYMPDIWESNNNEKDFYKLMLKDKIENILGEKSI